MSDFYIENDFKDFFNIPEIESSSFIITYSNEPIENFMFDVGKSKNNKRFCNIILIGILTFIFIILILYIFKKICKINLFK